MIASFSDWLLMKKTKHRAAQANERKDPPVYRIERVEAHRFEVDSGIQSQNLEVQKNSFNVW
jgi:lipopolysaccharide export system protein LptC